MKIFPKTLSLAFFGLTLMASSAQDTVPNMSVDFASFLAREDLVWNKIPDAWQDGAFLGNGLLGAMVYSDGTNALQWDVGRSDVTDRGDRMVIGRFAVLPGKTKSTGTMRLDLWNAEARGTLHQDGNDLTWRSFTHAGQLVNVIELTETRSGPETPIVFQHAPALPARATATGAAVPEAELNPEATFGETGGVNWCLQAFKAGGGYAVAWGEKMLAAQRRVFFFTVDYATNGAPTPRVAVGGIEEALKSDYDALVQTHRDWWHAYYPESFLSIPDTRMENFYWIQMYKLASATREDRPAMDLMGPWFHRTPWPHLWWNLNLQLTYWPVYTANRLELGQSLIRLIDDHRANLIHNVPTAWRDDSAAIGRSSPYDCLRSLKGGPGEERGDLTWALHDYWLQYRYSGDEGLLRNGLFPILKRAIAYYLHLLQPGPDGKLHLPVSISPEYPTNAPDTCYDLSLLRWGLTTLLAANERLELNDPIAPKWKETLAQLTPYPVDPAMGYMIGAGQPLAVSHRHFSHLLMVYPLHLVDSQSPADRPLIEKSLDHWMGLKGAQRGYSFTGAAAMSAWLGRKNDIVPYLNEILEFRANEAKTKYHVTANTLYLEAGPVIETPLAGAASIHEIVLQSWSMERFGTHLRVFPAVPDAWKDVSFHNLRAEGAFTVSAVRRAGRTKFVQIKSLAGAPCLVCTGLTEPILASGNRPFKVTTETDSDGQRLTTVDLRKDETVVLTSAAEKPTAQDWSIRPVAAEPERVNFYGVK